MAEFLITAPDGVQYKVTADSAEKAHSDLMEYRQSEVSQRTTKEFEEAPTWTKPFKAADDIGRGVLDTLSFGQADRFADYMQGTGDKEKMLTKAAKDRAGWAGTAADVATAAGALPTAVPRVVGWMGGGPAARTLVGGATAAGEGAGYGAASAAGHDEEIGKGAAIGGISGILGNAVGNIINKGTKLLRGIDDTPPKYNVRRLPDAPTPLDHVNYAKAQAERVGRQSRSPTGEQDSYVKQFGKVEEKVRARDFTKAEREALDRIVSGDPATNLARSLGDTASNKLGQASVFGGGLVSGNIPAAIGGPLAMQAVGKGLRSVSSGGTKEAVQDLRRLMYGVDKFKGPVSEEAKARFGAALRQLGLDLSDE